MDAKLALSPKVLAKFRRHSLTPNSNVVIYAQLVISVFVDCTWIRHGLKGDCGVSSVR